MVLAAGSKLASTAAAGKAEAPSTGMEREGTVLSVPGANATGAVLLLAGSEREGRVTGNTEVMPTGKKGVEIVPTAPSGIAECPPGAAGT